MLFNENFCLSAFQFWNSSTESNSFFKTFPFDFEEEVCFLFKCWIKCEIGHGASLYFFARNAHPNAGNNSVFSGIMQSSSLIFRILTKLSLSCGINLNGPPQKSIGGTMSVPLASDDVTCIATDVSTDAAMSCLLVLRLMRFCMSVFENTPQRDAIGYIVLWSAANWLSSIGSMPSRVAVWSIKAPVPPAHEPFILMSGVLPGCRKIILLSSPPMSTKVRTCGYFSFIHSVEAMTSCTNLVPIFSA